MLFITYFFVHLFTGAMLQLVWGNKDTIKFDSGTWRTASREGENIFDDSDSTG